MKEANLEVRNFFIDQSRKRLEQPAKRSYEVENDYEFKKWPTQFLEKWL